MIRKLVYVVLFILIIVIVFGGMYVREKSNCYYYQLANPQYIIRQRIFNCYAWLDDADAWVPIEYLKHKETLWELK